MLQIFHKTTSGAYYKELVFLENGPNLIGCSPVSSRLCKSIVTYVPSLSYQCPDCSNRRPLICRPQSSADEDKDDTSTPATQACLIRSKDPTDPLVVVPLPGSGIQIGSSRNQVPSAVLRTATLQADSQMLLISYAHSISTIVCIFTLVPLSSSFSLTCAVQCPHKC